MNTKKLSLRSALFINLNIILGTGIFINSALLSHHMGSWGALTYLVVGVLLLPLIVCLATLVTVYQGGSFYDYAAPVHPLVGFISQWSYFVGKMAACSLGIHTACSLIKTIFIPLHAYQTVTLDIACILIFCALNMGNLRINRSIQMLFFGLKVVPLSFIIVAGIIYFSPAALINTSLSAQQLLVTIPFALYAFTGFEATCSLIHTLEDPAKDGPRAIMYSYLISILIAILFQTGVYILIGPELRIAGTFLETFPLIFKKIGGDLQAITYYGVVCAHTAIACSALGAAYGIMFSNAWNLYTLAEKRLLHGMHYATRLTIYGVPYICIIVEACIAILYIWYTQGEQVSLQQVNTLALTTTFTLSVLGLAWYQAKKYSTLSIQVYGGLISCALLLIFLIKNFIYFQKIPMLPFIALMAWGIISFLTKFKHHKSA